MARRKKRSNRSTESYLASAKELSELIPSLKKYKKRKTLLPQQKAAITHWEKKRANIPFLVPVTSKQAKRLGKKKLFKRGFQAVQLRGVDTSSGAKVHITKSGGIETIGGFDLEVTDGSQRWIYWPLEKAKVRSRVSMREAGKSAFDREFPIEKLSDLTAQAFKTFRVQEVRLWAHAGIVGEGFNSIEQFLMWVNEKWQNGRYMGEIKYKTAIYDNPSDPGKWVNGIAILIENPEYTKRREELDAKQKAKNKPKPKAKKKNKRMV